METWLRYGATFIMFFILHGLRHWCALKTLNTRPALCAGRVFGNRLTPVTADRCIWANQLRYDLYLA